MSVSEIAQNVNQKRFHRELERMAKIPSSYILIEARIEEVQAFPHDSNLPLAIKNKIRMNGHFLISKLEQIKETYNVNVYYCINRDIAQDIAIRLMKEAVEVYG